MIYVPLTNFQKEIALRKKVYTKAIDHVLSNGWFILGKEVERFEEAFAKYLQIGYCVGVASGLEALQIALLSLGIGKGDEVITTPFSAVATTLAILAVGAKPVFVDTDEKGLLDPLRISKQITKRTKAILPVHLYGQSCDIRAIKKICRRHNLFLIEDAAQAHGTALNEKKAGTFGELGCFSFYPTKNLGAFGDGGAIVTNSKKLARICRQIRDYGQSKKYLHIRYGLNSRLSELQAAILTEKLLFLEKDNEKRRKLASQYIECLLGLPIEIVCKPKESNSHLFVIRVKKRKRLQTFLLKHGIQTDIHYPRLIPEQPFLKRMYDTTILKTAKILTKEVMSLPCNPFLTTNQVTYVCKTIKSFYRERC